MLQCSRQDRRSASLQKRQKGTANGSLCRIVEPRVSTTAERVLALKEFQKRGIPTVVWLTPILPFLNDTEENLRALLDLCFDAGVKGIVNFGFGVMSDPGEIFSYLDEFPENRDPIGMFD